MSVETFRLRSNIYKMNNETWSHKPRQWLKLTSEIMKDCYKAYMLTC